MTKSICKSTARENKATQIHPSQKKGRGRIIAYGVWNQIDTNCRKLLLKNNYKFIENVKPHASHLEISIPPP